MLPSSHVRRSEDTDGKVASKAAGEMMVWVGKGMLTLRHEAYSADEGIGGLIQDGSSHDCSSGESLGKMVDGAVHACMHVCGSSC